MSLIGCLASICPLFWSICVCACACVIDAQALSACRGICLHFCCHVCPVLSCARVPSQLPPRLSLLVSASGSRWYSCACTRAHTWRDGRAAALGRSLEAAGGGCAQLRNGFLLSCLLPLCHFPSLLAHSVCLLTPHLSLLTCLSSLVSPHLSPPHAFPLGPAPLRCRATETRLASCFLSFPSPLAF
jgi:hypothetical protein